MTARPDLRELFPAAGDVASSLAIDRRLPSAAYLIDGQVIDFSGDVEPVMSAIAVRDGAELRRIQIGVEARLGEPEAHAAVDAATRAWAHGSGAWPTMTVAERIAHLERFAAELEQRTEAIAGLLMYEIGKPLAAARKEVVRSVEYIRDTNDVLARDAAAWNERFTGIAGGVAHHAIERRVPLGIVLCVAPFNYPINEFLTTVAPALVMGNVVIAKTPRFGVLATLALADMFAQSFPPGAISLLPGDGRVLLPAIMKTGKVDMLAFIGSEGAAHAILSAHPTPATLHKVLGLGAKNAAIVLPGADVDTAAAKLVGGALGFNGQRCTAEKILYVPAADGERFAHAVAARVDRLIVGMPWTPDVAITPLPEPGKPAWLAALIADAVARGARVINPDGGQACASLVRPAVVYPVDPSMRLFHEEQFGPIVPIAPYRDVAEALAWQRESPYGQQVGIWGPTGPAAAVAKDMVRLVARVNLNDVCQRGPDSFGFTATDKSGFGVLSLRDALLTFSRPALIQSPDPAALMQLA